MAKDPNVLINAVLTLGLGLVFVIILLAATSNLIPQVQNAVDSVGVSVNVFRSIFTTTGIIILFIVASCFILTLRFIMSNFSRG